MQKIVILGKGGIGKSTIAVNLSAVYAREGKKVLHIGCDPKHDSTRAIAPAWPIETFMDKYMRAARAEGKLDLTPDNIAAHGRLGIDCIEAGGPTPGVGCAGRGIALMLEFFQETDFLNARRYDICIFDVLGDVVCGGFAAPLRKGFGEKILIVASEELLSLYAANNIASAVRTYASNGAYLAGLVANLKDGQADRRSLRRFANLLQTTILGDIPRDPTVQEAELAGEKTAVEQAPRSPFSRGIKALAGKVLSIRRKDCPLPVPMDEQRFREVWKEALREQGNK